MVADLDVFLPPPPPPHGARSSEFFRLILFLKKFEVGEFLLLTLPPPRLGGSGWFGLMGGRFVRVVCG